MAPPRSGARMACRAAGPRAATAATAAASSSSPTRTSSSLLDFKYKRHYKADRGEDGRNKDQYGAAGADMTIKVPVGTVIYDEETERADRRSRRRRRDVRARARAASAARATSTSRRRGTRRRERPSPARPARSARSGSSSSCSPTSACSASRTSASRRSSRACRARGPRSPTTRSRRWCPNLGVVRLVRRAHVRDRRHPRPHRGRGRGRGPGPPVPAPRRALPRAAPHRRGDVHDRAGSLAARRLRRDQRASWRGTRPTWRTSLRSSCSTRSTPTDPKDVERVPTRVRRASGSSCYAMSAATGEGIARCSRSSGSDSRSRPGVDRRPSVRPVRYENRRGASLIGPVRGVTTASFQRKLRRHDPAHEGCHASNSRQRCRRW